MTDDIEIEDAHDEESKDKNKAQQFTAFSKQKLGKGLQALKGQSCMYTVFFYLFFFFEEMHVYCFLL